MVYQGSKSRVAKDIVPIIQKSIDESNCDTFIDAFCGGANLIQHIKCENRIGYDVNPYLIALLNNLDKIPDFKVPISKEEYDICRAEWRAARTQTSVRDWIYDDWYIGAVGYIASFGGRFYDGGYAKDVPASDPKRHEHLNRKNNILKQTPDLIGCKFEVKDFFSLDCADTVIYCDPPYNGTKPYPYDNYDKDKFWDKVRELSEHNQVFVSELSAPNDFEMVWHKKIKNTVGLNNSLDQVEKLFIKK